MSEFEKLLDEFTYKVMHEKSVIWEERLKLWLRPKPKYIPDKLWSRIVPLVLIQTVENP